MVERTMVVIGLAALVILAAFTVRAVASRRLFSVRGRQLPDAVREGFRPENPGILYFYGPHCATCRRQAAVLDDIAREDGIAVVRVDAVAESALADEIGILTVPSTVIVDTAHSIRAVNLGLRSRDVLAKQVLDLAASA